MTDTPDIIEAMAWAIWRHKPNCRGVRFEEHPMRDECYREARAALTVALDHMREPSPKMLKAAYKSLSPERRPTPNRVSVKEKHTIRYQAMIDQLRKESLP